MEMKFSMTGGGTSDMGEHYDMNGKDSGKGKGEGYSMSGGQVDKKDGETKHNAYNKGEHAEQADKKGKFEDFGTGYKQGDGKKEI